MHHALKTSEGARGGQRMERVVSEKAALSVPKKISAAQKMPTEMVEKEARAKKVDELYKFIADESMCVAERLSHAVKVHVILCDSPDPQKLQERLDHVTHEHHLDALLALSTVAHPLNYITFRLILLYTHTPKCIAMLCVKGGIPLVMSALSKQQEPECVRFLVEILSRMCRSKHCREVGSLKHVMNINAQLLLHLVTQNMADDAYTSTRLHVLHVLESMLCTAKGRQVLLRAGAIYTVLNMLSQAKKGAFFAKHELSLLNGLKRELLFWEHLAHDRAVHGSSTRDD